MKPLLSLLLVGAVAVLLGLLPNIAGREKLTLPPSQLTSSKSANKTEEEDKAPKIVISEVCAINHTGVVDVGYPIFVRI